MAISYVTQASSTSPYLTMPVGIVAGDFIAVISGTYSGNSEVLQTSGYTFITTQKGAPGEGQASVFYKIANGNESGTPLSGPSNGTSLGVIVFRGVDPNNPLGAGAFTKTQASWTLVHTFPTVTTTSPSTVLWISSSTDSGSATALSHTFSNPIINQPTGIGASIFAAYQNQSTAGTLTAESKLTYNPSVRAGALVSIPLLPDPTLPPAPPEVTKVGAVASSNNTVTLPAGISLNDIIVLVAVTYSGNSTTLNASGYTQIASIGGGGAGTSQTTAWYKVAAGTESGQISGPTGGNIFAVSILRGIDPVNPVEMSAVKTTSLGWSDSHNFPTVTTTSPSYVMWIDGSTGGSATDRTNTFPAASVLAEYKGTGVSSFMGGVNQSVAGTTAAVSSLKTSAFLSGTVMGIPFPIKITGPRIVLSGPDTVKFGKSITVKADATSSDAGVSISNYAWTVTASGDSPTVSTPNNSSAISFKPGKGAVTANIGNPVDYTAKVTVTDSAGVSNVMSKRIKVVVDKWVKTSTSVVPSINHSYIGGVVYPQPIVKPDAPVANVSTQGLINNLVISWTTPNKGGAEITGYQIWKGVSSGTETLLTTVGAQQLSYTDSSVSTTNPTYYKIAAVNAGGAGSQSAEVNGTASNTINPIVAGYVVEDF